MDLKNLFSKSGKPKPPKMKIGRQKPLLALDISSMAVKLLELGRKGRSFVVESYAVEPLPANSVVEKRIEDVEAVAETIRLVVKRAKTKTKECALAVPGSAIINKEIQVLTVSNDAEMEEQIELEAAKHIPFPIEEINYDYVVLGRSEEDAERSRVLLVASRTENIDSRETACEVAGLKPRVMDVEPYALEHAAGLLTGYFPNGGVGKTVAMVDVGATMMIMTVLHDMETVYTRETQFGGKQLTEEIMRQFGLSHEEAGRSKRQGGLPANYNTEVLDPFRNSMAQQINRALQYFLTSSDYQQIDHVVLCGGSSMVPGISQLLESQLGTPVMVANPFESMSFASKVNRERLLEDAPAMMLATGLALRSFD